MNDSVCVVGGGHWGKNHIRTLYELGSLGAIVDSDKGLLKTYSEKYQHIKGYSNLDQAIDSQKHSAFIVATPAETHFEIAKKIINSGNHVLVEKPLTLSLSDAKALKSLSEKNKVKLMVGHVMLFHPAIIKIKEIIKTNKLGKILYIYSNRTNFGQVRTNENVLWSLGPHDISILQYLTGSFPIDLSLNQSFFLQDNISDSVILNLKYENGIEAHIFESWLHPFKEHRLVVLGSEAMICFDDSSDEKQIIFYKKKFQIKNKIPLKLDNGFEVINYPKKQALKEEIKYFIHSISNRSKNKSDADHAIEVMKILFWATEKSLKKESL